jgi:VWFA-related protein
VFRPHCIAGLAVVVMATQALAQEPLFRAATDAVEVDVRVTDRDGRSVAGLTAADFEVHEDGQAQVLTNVSYVDLGATLPQSAAAAADAPAAVDLDGRVYAIVLDDLHVAPQWSARMIALVRQFLERNVTPVDRVAIVTTGGAARVPFTADARLLASVLATVTGQKLPPASLEQAELRARVRELKTWTATNDPFERERSFRARAAMTTLRDVAGSLAELRGRRKAILFFSEGIDYDISDAVGRPDKGTEAEAIAEGMRQAVAVANRTNASFYTIDPRGGAQTAADAATSSAVDRQTSGALRKEMLMSHASLRELADVTGGLAAVNVNNLAGFFDRVVQDSTSYYLVSYSPARQRIAGFRKIDVRVRRRGLRVRARPGYTIVAALPASTSVVPPVPAPPREATPPVAAAPSPEPAVAAVPAPDLPAVLRRVAAYVAEYETKLAGVVAEERYRQSITNMSGPMRGRATGAGSQRDLRSDLLLVRPSGEDRWIQFRDVFEVDGRAIRDRDERLYKLFVEPTPASRRQAEIIQEEASRYNIGPLSRTINVPILGLAFFAGETQPSFRYRRVGSGDVRPFAGMARAEDIWVIEYHEVAKGTLIRGANNRDIPSRGRVWIDATTGRVLRTELLSEDVQVKAEIVVNYGRQPELDLLVPIDMREEYALTQSAVRIEGQATYNRFRRFMVTTSERPKPQ